MCASSAVLMTSSRTSLTMESLDLLHNGHEAALNGLNRRPCLNGDTSEESMTLTVRLIRSFEHRNIRFLVLRGVRPTSTVEELMVRIQEELQKGSNPPPFKKHNYNCLKIHAHAHGAKTNDTAINLDHEEWILSPSNNLLDSTVRNETELSYFNYSDYLKYKNNPQVKW